MAVENIKNRCQYWVKENQCKYWNSDSKFCGYTDSDDAVSIIDSGGTLTLPSAYKTCNYIGTAKACSHFDADDNIAEFRCILPDPSRHVGSYKSSSKYAFYVEDPDESVRLDTSLITGYSGDGTSCDGTGTNGGTNKTCTGFSPYQIGFGKILPTAESLEDEPKFSFKLPLNYSLLNLRSNLSTCYWWNGPSHIFELKNLEESDVPTKGISGASARDIHFKFPEISAPTGCTRSDTLDYTTHSFDNYPCNGSNSNCDHYTGICWQHTINNAIESGDKVLAEQILELRYYLKEEDWTYEEYSHFGFKNLQINAYSSIKEHIVGVKAVYDIVNVDLVFGVGQLTFNKTRDVLIDGTEVQQDANSEDFNETNSINFPTLVKDIKSFLLSPLIINNFYDHYGKNVHETNDPSKCEILIIGSQHTYTQDSVCINISKLKRVPDFFMYIEAYNDVNTLYAKFIDRPGEINNCASESRFHEIQEGFNNEINKIRLEEPDCIFSNTLDKESKGFIFEVDAPYGQNIIVVLSKYEFKGNNFWGYNQIVVYSTYVSGFLFQNDYTISESASFEGARFVDRLYDYRRSLFGYNRQVKFQFIPFTDKSLSYNSKPSDIFNDYKSSDLLDPTITYSGNKLYRFRNNFNYVKFENLYPIGPSGYVLVELEDLDNIMTDIHGKIKIKDTIDSDLYLELKDNEGLLFQCPMKVEKQGVSSGLQGNQFIISPKDMDNFKSICTKDSQLYINEILIPIRFNPENTPNNYSQEWELEPDPDDEDTSYVASGSVSQSGNEYIITDFNCSLIMTVGIKGVSGREINISKIKLAIWIKIPMAPDVEMFYNWKASYDNYQNHPQCTCCGPYTRKLVRTSSKSSAPPCGDHENSPTTGVGKMWWPYVQCSDFSYYLKISNQIYGGVTTAKGLYKEVDSEGNRVHGKWDIRMEGPDENDYYTGYYCCFICPCSCQVLTYNINRKADSESHFSGFCRHRGEVGEGTLKYWLSTGGALPKFGNTLRSQFISYRSTDNVQYIYYDYQAEKYKTRWMWMPSNMAFTDIDYTNTEDQVYSEFCNTDVLPINALGTMLLNNVDGKSVAEYIDDVRYSFDDVFEVYLEKVEMAYPKALHSNNNNPVLQYKSIGTSPIQWAWRDIAKDIERNYEEDTGFENEFEPVSVYLKFLDIYLTPYRFDVHNMEHRLTCTEGTHLITFKAPELDEDVGEYADGVYPTLQLDGGLERCFTWTKILDPDDCQLSDEDMGYVELTRHPWLEQGLFDVDYVTSIEEAQEAGTTLEEPSMVEPIKKYYNRGVSFDFAGNMTSRVVPVMFNTIPEFECFPLFVDTLLMDGQILNLEFSFSGIKKSISKGSIAFKYGILPELDEEHNLVKYRIYCAPAFKIVINNDIVFIHNCKIPNSFGIHEEVIDFDYYIDIDYLTQRSATFSITLDLLVPTDSNDAKLRPDIDYTMIDQDGKAFNIPYDYYMSVGAGSIEDDSVELIKDIVTLFDTVIVSASESIYVHERRYKISRFASDPIPPHGVNVGERVLSGRSDGKEYDTVWQRDKDGEVVNLPGSSGDKEYIHKTRSRFVFEAVTDNQYIHDDLKTMESAQEELYNKPMLKDTSSFSFTTSMYPDMSTFFDFHNLQRAGNTSVGSFNNNILYKLGTLRHYPKMQGKGFQLLPSLPWHEGCRHVGNRDGCKGDDVFSYSKKNMDDGSTETSSYDAADIFYGGTLLMMQRINIAKFLINRMSSKYEVTAKGRIFLEGEPSEPSIPEYMPMPGIYDTTPEWYPPVEERTWPYILPGLWQTLGKTDIFV